MVVTGNGYFGRECRDRDNFFKTGKRLARIILESEVCGQALPAYELHHFAGTPKG
ncbi:MAG: hypothetical protein ACLR0U_21690 [Enterocloster clostridioformis]